MGTEKRKSRVAWSGVFMESPYNNINSETREDIRKLIDDFGIILEDECKSRGISIFNFLLYKPFNLGIAVTKTHVLIIISPVVGTRERRWIDLQSGPSTPTIDQLAEATGRELGWSPEANLTLPKTLLGQDISDTSTTLLLIARKWIEQFVERTEREARIVKINPIFQRRDFSLENDLCFVLMPYTEPLTRLYQDYIKPTLEALNLRVIRADDLSVPTVIIEDIWEYINKARFIVADLTGRNPNVFYELGIAHTVGKDVIMLDQNTGDIPFDIGHIRYFQYTDNLEGWDKLQQTLESTVKAILDVKHRKK